jgi:hypothetical protein
MVTDGDVLNCERLELASTESCAPTSRLNRPDVQGRCTEVSAHWGSSSFRAGAHVEGDVAAASVIMEPESFQRPLHDVGNDRSRRGIGEHRGLASSGVRPRVAPRRNCRRRPQRHRRVRRFPRLPPPFCSSGGSRPSRYHDRLSKAQRRLYGRKAPTRWLRKRRGHHPIRPA